LGKAAAAAAEAEWAAQVRFFCEGESVCVCVSVRGRLFRQLHVCLPPLHTLSTHDES
jgi:hypothetical protein